MKVFKFILTNICSILILPLTLLSFLGAVWYVLPSVRLTRVGTFIGTLINPESVIWVIISCSVTDLILLILKSIFSKGLNSKIPNFYTHLTTWLTTLSVVAITVYTFIVIEDLQSESVIITNTRKILIGVCIVLLILHQVFSRPVTLMVNRKIQAYETSKETYVKGRSSLLWVNFLKMFEIVYVEIIVLALLCFCTSMSIATYFIVIMSSLILPFIGNLICDINIRREAKRKDIEKIDETTSKIIAGITGRGE